MELSNANPHNIDSVFTRSNYEVFNFRNNLQGRNTRVAVVLIQRNAPIPPGNF
jgi:hypothetical protein